MYFLGALTTKTYSFKLRVWEIKELKSFNFLDTSYQKILVQFKNFQVLRILPEVVEQGFNLDWTWLTDKTRFFFDSLSVKRTKKIIVAYKSKIFSISLKKFLNLSFCLYMKIKTLSYCKILLYFNNKVNIKKVNLNNLKIQLGFFQDINSIVALKNFYRILSGYTFQIYKTKKINDFNLNNFNYYFDNQSFDFSEIKMIILLGLDLRFELPSCYLNFKKQIKFSKIQFYSFGTRLLGRTNALNLGTNVFNFFEGRHWINNQVVKVKSLLCLNSKFLTSNLNISVLFSKYLNLMKQSYHAIFINDATLLNTCEVSVFNSNDFFIQNKKNEFFSLTLVLNYAAFLQKKKKSICLFFETNMDEMHFSFFDVIFPLTNFFEKDKLNIDLFGNVIKSVVILDTNNKDNRSENDIFNLSSLFFTPLNLQRLNFYSNIQKIKIEKMKTKFLNEYKNKNSKVLKTNLLFNYIKDFYLNDAVARFSETLIYVKLSFLKLRNNY